MSPPGRLATVRGDLWTIGGGCFDAVRAEEIMKLKPKVSRDKRMGEGECVSNLVLRGISLFLVCIRFLGLLQA